MTVDYKNAPLESILRSAEHFSVNDRAVTVKRNLVIVEHRDRSAVSIRKLAVRKSLQGWAESQRSFFNREKRCARAALNNDWIEFLSHLDHITAWSILDFAISEGKSR